MSALALHLSGTGPAARQFPVRYFEESLKHLVTGNGAKYTSVLRCALNASRVYSDLGLHREAAALLSTVATLVGIVVNTSGLQTDLLLTY